MFKIADIIIRRLGLGLVTLFFVSVLIFISVNSLPGDFAQEILGQGATSEAVAAIRAEIGLDRPIYERYFDWLFGAVQGNFGTSYARSMFAEAWGSTATANFNTVAQQLEPRFFNTLFLALIIMIFSICLSFVSEFCFYSY